MRPLILSATLTLPLLLAGCASKPQSVGRCELPSGKVCTNVSGYVYPGTRCLCPGDSSWGRAVR